MVSKSDWELRQQQWAYFHRWARTETQPEFPPEDVLDFLSTMLEWTPESVRAEERDPERRGVQRMHALLGAFQR